MKKKHVRKTHRHTTSRRTTGGTYLIVARSWMVFVMFALMLGMGAIVGSFIRTQLDQTTPQVAGVQTEAR